MQLKQHEIHLWTIHLNISDELENYNFHLLDADEKERAIRFLNPQHKKNFIAAHAAMRLILNAYLNCPAQEIRFNYNEFKKPYLSDNQLQFNLSHSHDIAILGIMSNDSIGVDIEKIKDQYQPAVAKRFFSPDENNYLNQLPENKKTIHFFKIWAYKEALIKAIGKGLSLPLATFSIPMENDIAKLTLEDQTWTLLTLPIHPDYQAAIATDAEQIKMISYWQFSENGFILTKTISL